MTSAAASSGALSAPSRQTLAATPVPVGVGRGMREYDQAQWLTLVVGNWFYHQRRPRSASSGPPTSRIFLSEGCLGMTRYVWQHTTVVIMTCLREF